MKGQNQNIAWIIFHDPSICTRLKKFHYKMRRELPENWPVSLVVTANLFPVPETFGDYISKFSQISKYSQNLTIFRNRVKIYLTKFRNIATNLTKFRNIVTTSFGHWTHSSYANLDIVIHFLILRKYNLMLLIDVENNHIWKFILNIIAFFNW